MNTETIWNWPDGSRGRVVFVEPAGDVWAWSFEMPISTASRERYGVSPTRADACREVLRLRQRDVGITINQLGRMRRMLRARNSLIERNRSR